jgi:hypothetical protein
MKRRKRANISVERYTQPLVSTSNPLWDTTPVQFSLATSSSPSKSTINQYAQRGAGP